MLLYADFVVCVFFFFNLKLRFYKISLVLWHPLQLSPMTFGSPQIVLSMCPQLATVTALEPSPLICPPLDCTHESPLFCHYILAKEGIVHRNRLYFLQWTVNRIICYTFAYILIEEDNPLLALYLGYQCKNMAEITKNKSTCVTSSTVLATGGSDDFKGGRRHLWKQRMTGPDNSYIKLT